jgi:3-hydroxyisobutyrate dehydrogenase-like beta-hydroxyacid dehydrogenase
MAKRSVGMLGLGIMGSAMAANLLKAGFKVVGYDPVAACRKRHRRAGGTLAESVDDVARRTTIVISSLPSEKALLSNAKAFPQKTHQIVIETSTLPVAAKEKARRILAARGVTLLDCPLSGTGAQARAKDLVVYASGPAGAVRRCAGVFAGFSRKSAYLGKFGNGSRMKFAANLLVAIHNVAAAEAMILATKSGLSPALAVKVLGDGAGSSRMLQVRGPMMARRRYTPATMSMKLWQKDMKIIGEFVRRLNSPAPLFSATKAIYNAALAQGHARQDTAAVHAVLESRRKR